MYLLFKVINRYDETDYRYYYVISKGNGFGDYHVNIRARRDFGIEVEYKIEFLGEVHQVKI